MREDSYEELMQPLASRVQTGASLDDLFPDVPEPSPVPNVNASLVAQLHDQAVEGLRRDILAHVYAQTPQAFEQLIIDVILQMGYGSRRRDLARHLGRSHDGGIDGVIEQDELALDQIYVQAKRLKPGTAVPIAQVRDFAGALEARHASKGVFVTTAHFSQGAVDFVRAIPRRVALIDGKYLAGIMIRHNLGVRIKDTYQFKVLEPAYFAGR